MKIEKVHARQILDSRGNPALEVELHSKSFIGSAAVPSGASTGIHEAIELRDKKAEYFGKGLTKAKNNVNKIISKEIMGMNANSQEKIDQKLIKLDGTHNKKRLGANAILGVSMAATRVGAAGHQMPLYEYLGAIYENHKLKLPIPFANVINGGVHAGNSLMFQEFMIAPIKAKNFSEATKIVSEIYHELKNLIADTYGKDATSVGDEGGFAPPLKNAEEALELMEVATKRMGYKSKVGFAMDAAASEFYDKKSNKYEVEKGRFITAEELAYHYSDLTKRYKLVSIEDPFDQDDYDAWAYLTKKIGKKIQIVGDDLTVTNPKRIIQAVTNKLCNALLLKINQIGTITESMQAAHLAQISKWNVMVSHRSGETEDPYIADLAVGLGCGQIKLGAPCRGERTAKYNQLLRIEELLGKHAKYAKF